MSLCGCWQTCENFQYVSQCADVTFQDMTSRTHEADKGVGRRSSPVQSHHDSKLPSVNPKQNHKLKEEYQTTKEATDDFEAEFSKDTKNVDASRKLGRLQINRLNFKTKHSWTIPNSCLVPLAHDQDIKHLCFCFGNDLPNDWSLFVLCVQSSESQHGSHDVALGSVRHQQLVQQATRHRCGGDGRDAHGRVRIDEERAKPRYQRV